MIDALWLTLRAAGFILLLQSAGTALFLTLFARQLTPAATPRIRALAKRTTLAALGLCLVQALFEPLHLAGAWDGLTDTGLLRLVFASPGALQWWLRCVGLAAVGFALDRPSTALTGLVLPGALIVLGSFLVNGHALIDPRRSLLAPLLGLHLLGAAFWFGSLAALRKLLSVESPPALVPVLASFSARALWFVPLLALAGVLLGYALLPNLAALRHPYGQLLCVKVFLFATLMGLAALNRLRVVPALARGEAAALGALRRTLAAEYVLIGAVLIATALMTGLFSPGEA